MCVICRSYIFLHKWVETVDAAQFENVTLKYTYYWEKITKIELGPTKQGSRVKPSVSFSDRKLVHMSY